MMLRRGLLSILEKTAQYDQTCGLRLHHASFRDFLLDRSHSEQFFVDSTLTHTHIVHFASHLFLGCIDSSWRLVLLRDLIQKRFLISFLSKQRRGRIPSHDTWGYLKHHFASHLYFCLESERQKVLDDFHRFHDEFKFPAKVDTLNDSHLVFESLHALMTALVNVGRPFIAFNIVLNMVIEIDRIIRCRPRNGLFSFDVLRAEHSHCSIDVSIDRLGFPQDTHSLCGKYLRLLDQFYHLALSTSTEFTRLLAHLPGFLTWKFPIPIEWLEDIYGVSNCPLWKRTLLSSGDGSLTFGFSFLKRTS
jgi:hypothetical protein